MSDGLVVRFLKFAGSSLIGGTVDILLVWLLSEYLFKGYWGDVVISPIISFECSILVGFTFCWYFIWSDRIVRKDHASFLRHLLAYNASNIGVFGIRMLLVVLIVQIFKGNLVFINLISRMLAGLLNFIISDKVIFKNNNKE